MTAVSVMVFHLGFWSWITPEATPAQVTNGVFSYPELIPYSWWGRYGVDVFFVISGFVIAYSAQNATPLSFARSRFLRLFPGALVCSTITFIAAIYVQFAPFGELFERYLRSAFLMPFGPWIDGVYWTLGIEIVFYGLIFLLVAMRLLQYIDYLAVLLVGLTFTRYGAFQLGLPDPFLALGITGRLSYLVLIDHGAAFAVGIALFSGEAKGWTLLRVAILAAGTLVGFIAVLHQATGLLEFLKVTQPPIVSAIIWLASVLAILVSVRLQPFLARITSERISHFISLLGIATYPLYLLHDLVGALFMRELAASSVNRYLALFITCAAMILASSTIVLWMEKVVRRSIASGWSATTRNMLSPDRAIRPRHDA